MAKVLKLEFIMNNGTTKTYSIKDPKSNLTLQENISAATLRLIETDFLKLGAVKPTSLKRAYYEETIVTDINE